MATPQIATHWTEEMYEAKRNKIAAMAKFMSIDAVAEKCQSIMADADDEYAQISDWKNFSEKDRMHKIAGDTLAEIAVIWASVPSYTELVA